MNLGSWFKGIKAKLLVAALLPLVGFAVLGYVAFSGLTSIGGMLGSSYTQIIPNVDALGQIEGGRARIGQYLWGAIANLNFEKRRNTYIEKLDQALKEYKDAVATYEAAPDLEGEREIYTPMKNNHASYVAHVEEFIQTLKTPTPENYEKVRAAAAEGAYQQESVQIKGTTGKIMAMYNEAVKKNNLAQEAERSLVFKLLVGIGLACSLGVFFALIVIASRLSKNVSEVVGQLSDSCNQVNMAITQLTEAGQSLSQSSTTSAASLEETVAALEEMSSMVSMNSDNAKQAANLSQASRSAAEDGEQEMQKLVTSMHGISQSSKKIEEIINVIDDIAFQTNLLALNAAVEAARAGEQGRGFAVVAEAVRSLAQRSAVAAKDINGLIKNSVDQVEGGSKIADKAGEVLKNIVTSIKKVSDLNNEISAASSEQTTGIQQISKAMNQLDQSSQANAASSEEIAATSEEMAAQSKQMYSVVVTLSNVVMGGHGEEAVNEGQPVVAEKKKVAAKGKPGVAVTKKTATNVVKFKPAPKAQSNSGEAKASELIPFDDDTRKVGNTDGF
ncbi:methyl-accepting chemotaxis protein [Bdellovibrio sp. KM01]|uniref:methyl-accepting chemotaxis protein n=1 Tax=Bdellovibrio sp. KM01 TaxID=2748865 RepID=UPI0015E9C0A4|nr:methyl-accepting chemotaxis protein [Bdellovibrio sp. KM01]QLY23807.1 MCP four helix bundle domain-containing protein [Bdellovibrio sp. KM01]